VRSYLKTTHHKRAGRIAQEVDCLPDKCEALSSNSRTGGGTTRAVGLGCRSGLDEHVQVPGFYLLQCSNRNKGKMKAIPLTSSLRKINGQKE
jgi:hypothetical protein